MEIFTLEFIWYLVIGAAVLFYIVLDGFDLGVGATLLIAKKDEERRIFLNAIGPVWDGNEVWLVIVVGGLFAGFPNAYATLLSSFYIIAMIFLASLIFRAVAIEFRSKRPEVAWRKAWDVVFCVASVSIAFFLGLVMGNLVEGIPLDQNGDFTGNFSGFFSPYTILLGVTAISLFAMHGGVYLLMKTEGELHDKLRHWINPLIITFVIFYVFTTVATFLHVPYMIERMRETPAFYFLGLIAALAIANIPREIHRERDGWAFISSCFGIIFLIVLFGIGTFPNLIRSSISPEQFSITLNNAASSEGTLKILLVIAGIGVPLVLAYGIMIYRIFRGKVRLGPTSY